MMIKIEYHKEMDKTLYEECVVAPMRYDAELGVFHENDFGIHSDDEIKLNTLYWVRARRFVGFSRSFYLFLYFNQIVTACPVENSGYDEEEFETALNRLLTDGVDLRTAFEFLSL